ncbi:MAG: hypothetical protein EOP38_17120 [Rubrivivax sp.]|nr:MAG: hypothetical protein EOP38_17120 [Rubrivivax sp.]
MHTVKTETAQSPTDQVQAWRAIAPSMVALTKLKSDEVLQPRAEMPVKSRDRYGLKEASEAHIRQMQGYLTLTPEAQLEPLLVADVGGKLYIVDGHHRSHAYRRQRRPQAPCRVQAMTMKQAVLLSKLVNLDGVKLPMHIEQQREALWQYLAATTDKGSLPLRYGDTLRSLEGRFGPNRMTVSRMLERLPGVDPTEFNEAALDPGTGFPLWRFVRTSSSYSGAPDDPEGKARKCADKVAAFLAKEEHRVGAEVFDEAMRMLIAERHEPDEVAAVVGPEVDCGGEF